jgi:hypothetical protein
MGAGPWGNWKRVRGGQRGTAAANRGHEGSDGGCGVQHDLCAGGAAGEKGWLVRVPKPGDRSQTISTVLLRDESLSTSGSYEKFFQLNGRTYGHITDPRTGEPVEGMRQATVIAADGTTTEARSKPMFVMGTAEGAKYLAGFPHVSGIWVAGEIRAPRVVPWNWPGCAGDCGDSLGARGERKANRQ